MTSFFNHQSFDSFPRHRQSLRNDRCQNILYKAVFEHFKQFSAVAALLLASKAIQNSSFGANFVLNFMIDDVSIDLLEFLLSPSSCFSLQFAPSLYIRQSWAHPGISSFVSELVDTKYLHLSLRSLTLTNGADEVLSTLFGSSSSNAWPQLQDLTLEDCELEDDVLQIICGSAPQLRTVDLSHNSAIIDTSLEHLATLSGITFLNLSGCDGITDAGLEHVAKLAGITSLNFSWCKKITDAGLKRISKLSGITSLSLSNNITDVGLQHISKFPNIKSIDLACCKKITDVGLEHISKISGITSLNLSVSDLITDAGIEHISKLSGITSLDLRECHMITNDAKQKLQTALPNCTLKY